MKKVIAILLVLAMVFALAACGTPANNTTPANQNNANESNTNNTTPEPTVYNVGMICIGDSHQSYDENFMKAADAAAEKLKANGIEIKWIYKEHLPEGQGVTDAAEELASEEKCIAVFLNSYGQEPAILAPNTVAKDHPDVVFAGLTNEGGYKDDLPNTINAFPNIFEARYLAGVAAGCKLNELIENGTITADKAVIGYVGAYPFAEVKSGYTAFFLGARSVCPSATMKVSFINSWGDTTLEANAAKTLIDQGAVLISQHSDTPSPASEAQKATEQGKSVFHVGYNVSMIKEAPDASIISSRIDWTNFFVKVITAQVKGEKQDQDYIGHGLKDGDVCLTELNEKVAAKGTAEAIKKAEDDIKAGKLQVFDTSTFTVGGAELKNAFALDTNGDFVPDSKEAVFDGAFHESYFQSAPYFGIDIDGIELLQ